MGAKRFGVSSVMANVEYQSLPIFTINNQNHPTMHTHQPEFWEANFAEKQAMWGFEPAPSAVLARDLFVAQGVKSVLIPGIGYGRNAQVFKDSGMEVTGIEISATAIALAQKHYGTGMAIHHGSVTDMPFDDKLYEGIFCYALIHLLDSGERQKLISDCYNQLSVNGYMVFVAISKAARTYGQGRHLGPDRYEVFPGVQMYFYDKEAVDMEFGNAGLFAIEEVNENYPFYFIKCRKCWLAANTKKPSPQNPAMPQFSIFNV